MSDDMSLIHSGQEAVIPTDQTDKPVLATWAGESAVLWPGSVVEVLMSDPLPGEVIDGYQTMRLPGRTACWVRYWPDRQYGPLYRSCDLCDLEMSDEDFDKLSALPEDENSPQS
jgi:hypothetical protein